MDDATDPPVTNPQVDVMDVSPAVQPHIPSTLDDKENEILDTDTAPPLATVKPTSTALISPEDDNRETEFTYVLRRYPTIQELKVHSPWHWFGSFCWRLLIFPKGNQSSNHDLSVYLECGGPERPPDANPHSTTVANDVHHPPNGKEAAIASVSTASWSRPAKFSLHLVHPSSPIAKRAIAAKPGEIVVSDHSLADLDVSDSIVNSNTALPIRADVVKETNHIFKENASDWGFLEFAPFSTLQPSQYADDDMNVVIMVRIRLQDYLADSMFNSATWDSRKETGFVGFKNQGATCYMNSLLQTLYMVSAFRKAVYNMPLPESGNEYSGSELSYALQKVFYELQFSPTVVKTKKLTESFGWDTTDAFTQHDVQELKLILCDELAEKMKKIAPDQPNTLSTLFQGKLLNYIECINVDYKSTREEDFSDLSLNVKGCRNVYDSLEKYTEVEMMSGDNKYRADGFDELQEARKGVKFLKLPPVLQLHLKRFEYDFTRYAMVKINDRYEFETEIDLSRFVENSDGTDIYCLHSVLVHIGDVNGGHYHVFIRPEIDVSDNGPLKASQWFKFDDETVTSASEENAVQDNFGVGGEKDFSGKRGPGMDDEVTNGGVNGGQTPPPSVFQSRNRNYQAKRFSNAYMLQYLRKSDIPYLLKSKSDADVPNELGARIIKEREEEEQRKRERAEQHLYMNIAVATNENMITHHDADLVQWEKVRQLRVKRALQLGELKIRLQHEGIVHDARRMRLWKCLGRQNETVRPDTLVANGLDGQPITDANSRDPLAQTGYNVPLYSGRHGYYGQDDVVKMYAEDFCSPFCLGAGEAYTSFITKPVEAGKGALSSTGSTLSDDQTMSENVKMETDSGRHGISESPESFPPFRLALGREVLLFVKYYSPSPVPRLQWLGHVVVDRSTTVRELPPLLRRSLEAFRRKDGSLPSLDANADISVHEEVSASNISTLPPNSSLEDQRIPFEGGGGGDILVFQKAYVPQKAVRTVDGELDDRSRLEEYGWNGLQEPSRGDESDLPLGGRPLPTVSHYFEYLACRIKIEFKDKSALGGPDEGKTIFFELLRKDTYKTARKVLVGVLGDGADADYLRLFAHDFHREAPAQEPLRISDNDELRRVLPMHNLVSTGQPDYKILWYERTEYHISEFEHKDEVRVVWRQDGGAKATLQYSIGSQEASGMNVTNESTVRSSDGGLEDADATMGSDGVGTNGGQVVSGDQAKSFSVLVPLMSKYIDVMDQVRIKLRIGADVEIRMFEVKNSKIFRFINPSEPVPPLMTGSHDCGAELRAEPVPVDESEEALGEEYELVTVLHLAKDKQSRKWHGPIFFGTPFVIKVRKQGERVKDIRARIQDKLGIAAEEFDKWPLAEVVQLKVIYLLEMETMYSPQARNASVEFCSLAIEHKSTAPAKKANPAMNRYADKPLKIRS